MRIVSESNVINTAGYVDRVERGYVVKHVNKVYQHVKEPVIVPKPQVEDFNNLVVVHDMVEQYA